jgi:hypothetical protein
MTQHPGFARSCRIFKLLVSVAVGVLCRVAQGGFLGTRPTACPKIVFLLTLTISLLGVLRSADDSPSSLDSLPLQTKEHLALTNIRTPYVNYCRMNYSHFLPSFLSLVLTSLRHHNVNASPPLLLLLLVSPHKRSLRIPLLQHAAQLPGPVPDTARPRRRPRRPPPRP